MNKKYTGEGRITWIEVFFFFLSLLLCNKGLKRRSRWGALFTAILSFCLYREAGHRSNALFPYLKLPALRPTIKSSSINLSWVPFRVHKPPPPHFWSSRIKLGIDTLTWPFPPLPPHVSGGLEKDNEGFDTSYALSQDKTHCFLVRKTHHFGWTWG